MVSLSVCMIVKNEASVLGRALECVKNIADEIIVVDTGSTDETKQIAQDYTCQVFDFPWVDDFAAARNFSFSKATKDYLMWLDADDVIDASNQAAMTALKETISPTVTVVMMKYHTAFDQNNQPTFTYYRERWLNRKANLQWVGAVHEVIAPTGQILHSEIAVSHQKLSQNDPLRNLKIYEKIIAQGKSLDPRQQFYYARELYYNGKYEQAIAVFQAFLENSEGWIENKINACKDLADCYTALHQPHTALTSLLKSFIYDAPRAEICCALGNYFLSQDALETAIFWYSLALSRPLNAENGGFCLPDCYGYIPYMQLCLCYDRLGQFHQAFAYNELAGKLKPNDPSYQYNQNYFKTLPLDFKKGDL